METNVVGHIDSWIGQWWRQGGIYAMLLHVEVNEIVVRHWHGGRKPWCKPKLQRHMLLNENRILWNYFGNTWCMITNYFGVTT